MFPNELSNLSFFVCTLSRQEVTHYILLFLLIRFDQGFDIGYILVGM